MGLSFDRRMEVLESFGNRCSRCGVKQASHKKRDRILSICKKKGRYVPLCQPCRFGSDLHGRKQILGRVVRRAIQIMYGDSCLGCGSEHGEGKEKKLTHLLIHHLDYIWANNRLDNQAPLCIGCHAAIDRSRKLRREVTAKVKARIEEFPEINKDLEISLKRNRHFYLITMRKYFREIK